MAKDFSNRIKNLQKRRLGLDTAAVEYLQEAFDNSGKVKSEAYESRSSYATVRYVLGAMQEVDGVYTGNGIQEANRVAAQLKAGLNDVGTTVAMYLQGSVPLNVHIRGASDVDMLTMHEGFFSYAREGVRAKQGYYTSPAKYSTLHYMTNLRQDCERILAQKFPAAKVDTSGSKAIAIEGGSLRRKIDVVPAKWFDDLSYQQTLAEYDRAVDIWDKVEEQAITNKPFLFIKKVNDRDAITGGNLKKCIRLLKNIKKDAIEEGRDIKLSSYDIASIMWHCDAHKLNVPSFMELSLLVVIEQHFEYILSNPSVQSELMTPDGSRKIFNEVGKAEALFSLLREVKDLAAEVSRELQGGVIPANQSYDNAIQKALVNAAIH